MRPELRLYALLLHLYPPDFRKRYGPEMLDDMRRLGGDAARSVVWRRVLGDLARSVPREWVAARRTAAPKKGRESAKGPSERGWGTMGGPDGGGGDGWGRSLVHEVRLAARSLWRAPGFTALSVGVLAIGIGTATAIFSAVNAYLIRPLPYPESDRLVELRPVPQVSWEEAEDLFEHPVSWDLDAFTMVGDGGPELLLGSWITPGYLEAYGIRPALGRSILPEEAGDGRASVVMISWDLWQRRFGGDPGVLGTRLSAFTSDRPDDAESFEIIGVLPRDLWFPNPYTEVLAPLRAPNPVYAGRLRQGVSPELAAAELTRRSLERMESPPPDFAVRATLLRESYVAGVRPTLWILLAAAGLVLAAACANAAILILVRAAARERERAIRRALGAGWPRLVRERALEGLLLTLPAALFGAGLAALGLEVGADRIAGLIGQAVPGGSAMLSIDGTVTATTIAVALATGLLFGVVPLLGGAGRSMRSVLGEGGRGGTDTRRSRGVRTALVGAELAVSLGLLATAGLTIRSASRLQQLDPGFEAEGLVKTQIQVRNASYPDPESRMAFYDAVLAAAGSLPGVQSAGRATRIPFTWNFGASPLESEGSDGLVRVEAASFVADSGYFATMRIPVLQGRGFAEREARGGDPPGVLVSQRLAVALWPGGDPVGRSVRRAASRNRDGSMGEPGDWLTVVGVVGDVLTSFRAGDPPELYYPLAAGPASSLDLVLRTEGAGVPPELAERIRALDAEVPLSATRSLLEAVDLERSGPRFLAALMTAFSLFTALLATAGLYGVIAYAVAQQRREIAVRMALGAAPSRVVGLFVRNGLAPVAVGSCFGVLIAFALGRVLASQLYGVGSFEAVTYAVPLLLLGGAAFLATWVPARRAARTAPIDALRDG